MGLAIAAREYVTRARTSNDLIYSVRAASGKVISKEKPSFAAGAAGGCGLFLGPAPAEYCSVAGDFVTVPIGSSEIAGASQALRARASLPSNGDRMSAPEPSTILNHYEDQVGQGKTSPKSSIFPYFASAWQWLTAMIASGAFSFG